MLTFIALACLSEDNQTHQPIHFRKSARKYRDVSINKERELDSQQTSRARTHSHMLMPSKQREMPLGTHTHYVMHVVLYEITVWLYITIYTPNNSRVHN